MFSLVLGLMIIIGAVVWWVYHCMDMEIHTAHFAAPLLMVLGLGICIGSFIYLLE